MLVCCHQSEVQLLIGGAHGRVDLDDLEAHTNYTGGYSRDSPVVQWLWQVLREIPPEQVREFLMFTTSCSRAPLLGFEKLYPPFTIQWVPNPQRVPGRCVRRAALVWPAYGLMPDCSSCVLCAASATCMNVLKLPPYPSKEVLREKLLYAITSGAGFGLS